MDRANLSAFLGGVVGALLAGAFAYYAIQAFNAYVDARARAVVMQFFHDLPTQTDVTPPAKRDT